MGRNTGTLGIEIGARFGRLVVVAKAPSKHEKARYVCRCDCGGENVTEGSRLRAGTTQSCGCLRRELSAQKGQKFGKVHIRKALKARWGTAGGKAHGPRGMLDPGFDD
jgi:N-acetylmuramic acid 6-phosphate (MurNAc-6-P) etherase